MATLRMLTLGLMAFGLGGLAGQIARGWAMAPPFHMSVRVPVPVPVQDRMSSAGGRSSVLAHHHTATAPTDDGAESVASTTVDSPAERAHAAAEQAVADISVQYAAEYVVAEDGSGDDDDMTDAQEEVVFEFNDAVFADRRRTSFFRRLLSSWCRAWQQPPREIYLRT